MTNKRKFKWNKIKQYAFNKIKWIIACYTLLTYPDFNENFKTHANDSNLQLWVAISQKYKLIHFYSRKITDPQKHYTVTEKEMSNIFETLK